MENQSGISAFLFRVDPCLNQVKNHNINFKVTQTLRLVFILASFTVWGILSYVWVKDFCAKLQFWIMTLWLYAYTIMSIAAGAKVVEEKKTLKLRRKEEPKELPQSEVSTLWISATKAYAFATPLVLASPIMFTIFHESMIRGEVCKFYELANTSETTRQEDCLLNYASTP